MSLISVARTPGSITLSWKQGEPGAPSYYLQYYSDMAETVRAVSRLAYTLESQVNPALAGSSKLRHLFFRINISHEARRFSLI